mmetsp:Transcript_82997/g.257668  ORF Transcript_82997/g.257668 Transcript_82997/m.257668 type:complete len:111 (+) Transcript_82997:163-495(+)
MASRCSCTRRSQSATTGDGAAAGGTGSGAAVATGAERSRGPTVGSLALSTADAVTVCGGGAVEIRDTDGTPTDASDEHGGAAVVSDVVDVGDVEGDVADATFAFAMGTTA